VKGSSAIVTLFTLSVVQSKVDSEVLGKQLLCGNQVFISSLCNKWEAGQLCKYTAVSTKVVPQKRKSARDNADWYYE